MSLDVYLTLRDAPSRKAEDRIYIREDGQTKEISLDEWNKRFPGREPAVVRGIEGNTSVYSANITHNLGKMADLAGIYEALWEPETRSLYVASDLITPLRDGLAKLQAYPEAFKTLNPANGWGNYDLLCRFVADYLAACEKYPDADVTVSR